MGASYMDQLVIPEPGKQILIESEEEFFTLQREINDQNNSFNRKITTFMDDLYNVMHNGYLVRNLRIEEVTADKVIAGIVAADKIYIGSDRFELDGVLTQLRIKDDQGSPVTVVALGDFASGTDFGIQIRNSSDAVVFQALSNAGTFIDGVVISSGTIGSGAFGAGSIDGDDIANNAINAVHINGAIITGAMIVGGTITNVNITNSTITNSLMANNSIDTAELVTGAVTNAKIDSLSASKITVSGTLTCSSAKTAINVINSGVVAFSGGGDIIMKAVVGDHNFIIFRTSGGTNKGKITYDSGADDFKIRSENEADIILDSAADVLLEPGSGDDIRCNGHVFLGQNSGDDVHVDGLIVDHLLPKTDSTYNLGSASLQWATVYRDAEGDIPMRNAFVITEPDMVYKDVDRDSGLCFMVRTNHIKNKDWEWFQVAFLDRQGVLHCKGVNMVSEFKKPDYPYKGNRKLENSFHKTNKTEH